MELSVFNRYLLPVFFALTTTYSSFVFADTTQHNSFEAIPDKNEIVTHTDFGVQTYIFHFNSGGQHLSSIDFINRMDTESHTCDSWKYVSALDNYNIYKQTILKVSTDYNSAEKYCVAHAYASNNGDAMGQILHMMETKSHVDIAGFNISADGFSTALNKL
ncbi:hypothetical protein F6477_01920 [Photobacterium damselae subsp. damselae]|nr:hypothetical protein F6477_01920 [Photobacterium damselae subsp. damselae]MBF7097938.1 hypothetical protein [Photobacterium damselae]